LSCVPQSNIVQEGNVLGNYEVYQVRYTSCMRVLGIDCGGEYTGYGVVQMDSGGRLVCLTCGAIKLSPRDPLARRLSRIYTELGALIVEHSPDEVAIEGIFYALNVKSALKLGQVRGVAMLAAAVAGLEVAEYSPLTIKSSVVGYGRAEKQQVQHMVTRLLSLAKPPEPMDASDALAIAICHLHTAGTLERQRAVARG
jgi:crossover junction endodeoxyribonuclease RuvC